MIFCNDYRDRAVYFDTKGIEKSDMAVYNINERLIFVI